MSQTAQTIVTNPQWLSHNKFITGFRDSRELVSSSPGMRRPSLFPAEAFPPVSCPSGICIHLLWGNSQSWCTSHSLQKKKPT